MAEIKIAQREAQAFIDVEKRCSDNSITWTFPLHGEKISVPLISIDAREEFLLDISRGRIDLNKVTYQNRVQQVIILLRLDIGSKPHRNPDGEEVPAPHLHIYREGYGDKWAYPIPKGDFREPTDVFQTLEDFMDYCYITGKPNITKGLFT